MMNKLILKTNITRNLKVFQLDFDKNWKKNHIFEFSQIHLI